ncbi:YezD family protein [Cohnella caldifontis]|uniref:YezD family protein n=1 Tax=Cohnella caldifontis TaxID=3027471 RepID=UPI0023EB0C11|nr:YezD family protein [Cohnella sp. YIM B05605]
MTKPVQWNEEWNERIREAVEGLAYGTVQIVVHDGRIVQIERTEKFRYEGAKDSRVSAASSPKPNGTASL